MPAIAILFFLLPPQTYSTLEQDQWQRLYTFDSSTVDISTTNIWFGSDYTGRVRLRLTLAKPEPVSKNAKTKYQTVIETMELRCEAGQYRVVEVKRYDAKGSIVGEAKAQPVGEWTQVKRGSMMDKYFGPGCEVVYQKKQNP